MKRAQPLPPRRESDQTEKSQQHDDSVKAGSLPVAASEMEPHAELIEGQRHGKAVDDRAQITLRTVELREEQDCSNCREKEYPVIQMMDVCAAHMQKKIGYPASHNQNHEDPGRDKGQQQRAESKAREMPFGRWSEIHRTNY